MHSTGVLVCSIFSAPRGINIASAPRGALRGGAVRPRYIHEKKNANGCFFKNKTTKKGGQPTNRANGRMLGGRTDASSAIFYFFFLFFSTHKHIHCLLDTFNIVYTNKQNVYQIQSPVTFLTSTCHLLIHHLPCRTMYSPASRRRKKSLIYTHFFVYFFFTHPSIILRRFHSQARIRANIPLSIISYTPAIIHPPACTSRPTPSAPCVFTMSASNPSHITFTPHPRTPAHASETLRSSNARQRPPRIRKIAGPEARVCVCVYGWMSVPRAIDEVRNFAFVSFFNPKLRFPQRLPIASMPLNSSRLCSNIKFPSTSDMCRVARPPSRTSGPSTLRHV